MFIFFPYRVDVPFNYRPVVNWLVVAVVILVFGIQMAEIFHYSAHSGGTAEYLEYSLTTQYGLDGWGIKGLLGSMWLHGGPMHLMWNSLYLWLFGNAVCSKLGNLRYLPVYIVFGVAGGIGHLLFDGEPALGASGAISGLIGMHLVFFPENSISCFFCWIFLPHRPVWFSLRSFWLILIWFALNIYGVIRGSQGVGYFAHIGGFVAGVGLALLLLKTKHITVERHERSVLDLLGLEKKAKTPVTRGDRTRWQRKWENKQSQEAEPKTTPSELEGTPEQFIRFKCNCGQRIKVSRQYAGRNGRCPKCSSQLRIPEA
ncbi:MAG: rhomboid family intramembrane serine protease [Planctomycetota bacterium]